MVRKRTAILIPLIAGLLAAVILLNSFGEADADNQPIILREQRAANPFNRKMVDSAVHQLKTGDIVLRTGADITSYMFSQMNQRNKVYSHCGIVIVENGYPFVYHSIGGEDNPNQRLKRDSASFWFSPANNLGIGVARFDTDTPQLTAITSTVRQFYREHRMFDMSFDLASDDRLYCAEFAYKALNQALKDSNFIKPVKVFGHRFVGVDDIFMNGHTRLIWQVRYK